jgi:2-polyprenyl-3-methyl-5-hydroxy-6-metoxy-1,4-benzoquinol methylase
MKPTGPSHMPTQERYFQTRLPYDPRRAVVWKEVCRYLERHFIPPGATVLDIGAGYGEFINQVRARERHAVDLTDDLARYFADGVTLHVHSCTSMPSLADASFDVVFASNVLEHLNREEVVAALAEVTRVLKPGGKLILIQPNFKYSVGAYFDDYTHLQIYTHVSLADLLAACGFDIVRVEGRFLPLTMKSRLPTHALLVRAYLASPLKPLGAQMLVVARKPPGVSAR